MNCLHCNKPLVSIGYKRINGKQHNDWDNRKFHKKCSKQMFESKRALEILESYKNK